MAAAGEEGGEQLVLVSETVGGEEAAKAAPAATSANLKTIADVPHEYHLVDSPAARAQLIQTLQSKDSFCLDTETTSLDPKEARLVGLAFSFAPHTGYYVPLPLEPPPRPSPPRRVRGGISEYWPQRKPQEKAREASGELISWRSSARCWSRTALRRSGTTLSSI